MKTRRLSGQAGEQVGAEGPVLLAHVEQLALVELAHADGVFKRLTFATDYRLVGGAGDWHHIQIQVRGQAGVQTQFLLAEMLAASQGGEIEKPEIHGLLDLIGVVAGEDHLRDVGLKNLKIGDRVVVQRRSR